MLSPRHSPPPSAAAPKPKGILKNAGERTTSKAEALATEEDAANRLQWDESNLTLHEIEREQQDPRMKIDEPKTPFVHGTALGPVGDEDSLGAADVAHQLNSLPSTLPPTQEPVMQQANVTVWPLD
uniref:Uncharacterized protein n=1 Tax=Melanopsichium pennsylvanicum 4 TaxID=1398559 RepID=A0A077RCS7_9BASI|nr:conserved hypothetical protein [Melanopsichium pennsylvanicum 4]